MVEKSQSQKHQEEWTKVSRDFAYAILEFDQQFPCSLDFPVAASLLETFISWDVSSDLKNLIRAILNSLANMNTVNAATLDMLAGIR